MTKSFEFIFDIAGPNSFLAHRVLGAFCAETGAQPVYVPVLLGGLFKATGNMAPMIRYAETPAKRDYELLEFRRFIEKHAIVFTMNPHFPVNSLVLMRTIVAAGRQGQMAAAVEAAMTAMWEQGANLADPDSIRSTYDAAGLDGAALLALAAEPDVKAELVANTDRAVARGAFGVPSFFAGDDIFWGKERLDQLAEVLAKA